VEVWELSRLPVAPHKPEILRSDDEANRVIVIVLPAGESLQEHQVHEHALVFLIEGTLRVSAGDEDHELSAPSLVYFDPAERHEVAAISDCRVVLCLAPWPGVGHPSRVADAAS
jgi:quercetin dioxygenase-like cupin family protein